MSGFGVRHTDWLNENAYRRYPLVDGATADVPDGLIVDLVLSVSLDFSPNNLYLKQVAGYNDVVVLFFGNAVGGATVATSTIFVAEHELNKSYAVVGQGLLEGSIGRLNIGTSDALLAAASGVKDFTASQARIVAGALRPALRGITALNADGTAALSGSVRLVGGVGVTLVPDPVTKTITINSQCVAPPVVDDTCGCGIGGGSGEEAARVTIKTINGMSPNSSGNFEITGLGGVDVIAEGGAIRIEDNTTEPCCECEQLEALYAALQTVTQEALDLRSALTAITTTVENYKQSLDQMDPNAPAS